MKSPRDEMPTKNAVASLTIRGNDGYAAKARKPTPIARNGSIRSMINVVVLPEGFLRRTVLDHSTCADIHTSLFSW